MCIAVPGEIKEINNSDARVLIMGIEIEVNIQLIENPQIGDFVLIHAGCAIEKINKEYFDDINSIYKILDEEDFYE